MRGEDFSSKNLISRKFCEFFHPIRRRSRLPRAVALVFAT